MSSILTFWLPCCWYCCHYLAFKLREAVDSTLHGTMGKKAFGKITPKLVQTTFGHFGERFWAFLEFWKFFDFFKIFFEDSTLHGTLSNEFSQKQRPKTRLDTSGNDFGRFWNFEKNLIFWFFSKSLPHILSPEKLTPNLKFGESELVILGLENLKWYCVYWLWREYKKNNCWVLSRKTERRYDNVQHCNWTVAHVSSESRH